MTSAPKPRASASIPMGSVRLVWPFLALARGSRPDAAKTAARLGLTESELNDPDTRVPQTLVVQSLLHTLERTGERDIGLIAARYVDGLHLGIGDYIARTRPTLAAAIAGTNHYLPLLLDGAGHAVERSGKYMISTLWFDPRIEMPAAAYEFAVAVCVLWTRRLPGFSHYAPHSVHFMHARPASTKLHREIFRCPVHFNAETTKLIVPIAALETRLASAEPVLCELLERQAEAMLATLPTDQELAGEVRRTLAAQSDLTGVSQTWTARRLGMSVRTLTRKLRKEGTTFGEIFDDVRMNGAIRQLAQSHSTLSEVASRLGFASTQSFQRAFRRWTGNSADQFRRRARAKASKIRS